MGFSFVESFGGVLLLLLEWKILKIAANSELGVDITLGDVEFFDVEEPFS